MVDKPEIILNPNLLKRTKTAKIFSPLPWGCLTAEDSNDSAIPLPFGIPYGKGGIASTPKNLKLITSFPSPRSVPLLFNFLPREMLRSLSHFGVTIHFSLPYSGFWILFRKI
jgi:hypothetical protein